MVLTPSCGYATQGADILGRKCIWMVKMGMACCPAVVSRIKGFHVWVKGE
jgi:hypothetical protein